MRENSVPEENNVDQWKGILQISYTFGVTCLMKIITEGCML